MAHRWQSMPVRNPPWLWNQWPHEKDSWSPKFLKKKTFSLKLINFMPWMHWSLWGVTCHGQGVFNVVQGNSTVVLLPPWYTVRREVMRSAEGSLSIVALESCPLMQWHRIHPALALAPQHPPWRNDWANMCTICLPNVDKYEASYHVTYCRRIIATVISRFLQTWSNG